MPADTTPMMQQYNELRSRHPDCILFFRLGDFYEMFDSDAVVASKLLDLTLTTRDRGKDEDERTPMCGVPYHSAEAYIARLIAKGHKIAICEQTEDPAQAKGLVKREVVRIITPGTVLESAMMSEAVNHYLSAVVYAGGQVGVATVDVTTGEYYATQGESGQDYLTAKTELGRFMPKEVLLCDALMGDEGLLGFIRQRLQATVSAAPDTGETPQTQELLDYFGYDSLSSAGLEDRPCALAAIERLLAYTRRLGVGAGLSPLLNMYDRRRYMELDLTAKRNMELVEPLTARSEGDAKGTLLWVLDRTGTSIGSRLLRSWIERPLTAPGEITRRGRAVGALVDDTLLRSELRGALKNLPDMERLTARIVFGTGGPRDLRSLAAAAGRVPFLLSLLGQLSDPLLRELYQSCDPLEEIQERLAAAIIEDPPHSSREGGFIREGYHEEADRLRGLLTGSKAALAAMETAERESTGIKNLKIGYNKVFGYYIEVSKSHYHLVPESYIRKQTLANCERFYTQQLKELEGDILSAGDRLKALELELFSELRTFITERSHLVQRTAAALAQADVLSALADCAVRFRYCCPIVDHGDVIQIEEGRHPVVECMLEDGLFVPNSTELSAAAPSAIITGPNMAGKSTYMRQVALITLMAQIGSFVPAKSARIGVVDRIFTRVGASDDLAGGRSTFMVEMSEVSDILRFATQKSLIILDEVGRGTSTFDGMSVARAVLEHIHTRVRAKTLFATHYHELTDLEQQMAGIKNYSIAVKKRGEEIVFLRRIVAGGADDSFGIEVAKLAGLPDGVITRARAILRDLENAVPVREPKTRRHEEPEETQLGLSSLVGQQLVEELMKLDIDTLTPLEAMNYLYALRKKAGETL